LAITSSSLRASRSARFRLLGGVPPEAAASRKKPNSGPAAGAEIGVVVCDRSGVRSIGAVCARMKLEDGETLRGPVISQRCCRSSSRVGSAGVL
jgi:hypothetical protein